MVQCAIRVERLSATDWSPPGLAVNSANFSADEPPSGDPERPGALLTFINHHLASRYTADIEAFVTAFYGIYDPVSRSLTYANAGHNPPRLKRCEDGSVASLDGVGSLPLGVDAEMTYEETTHALRPGDQII